MNQMLIVSMRMLSIEHNCNIVRLNLSENVPEINKKVFCRGQIEMLKRLIVYDNDKADLMNSINMS